MKTEKPNCYESVEKRDDNGVPVLVRMLDSIEDTKQMAQHLHTIEGAHQLDSFQAGKRRDFVGRTWKTPEKVYETLNDQHKKTQETFDACMAGLDGVELPLPEGIKRRSRIREDGERLDLQRFRDGDPNRYWQTNKVILPGGHSTLVVAQNYTANCDINPWDMAWRGAAGAVLCKLLSDAGYDVEYWMYAHTTGPFKNAGNLEQAIKIKGCNERPDWVRIANLTSSWMFRTVLFALFASDEDNGQGEKFGGGNGSLGRASYNWDELRFLKDRIAQGRPVLHVEGKPFSKSKAIEAVKKSIEDFKASF